MTYEALIARMARRAHRSDLTDRMESYVEEANQRINRRFGIALVAPSPTNATNELLDQGDELYFLGGMKALYEDTNNGDNATYYANAWELEADRQNVTGAGGVTDPWTVDGVPPVITPTGA